MKALSTRSLPFLILFLLFPPTTSWANRTIRGSVGCDGINIPDRTTIRVSAYDADGDADELMGRAFLTDCNTFEITYEQKKWDPFPMEFTTWWRPDIYLLVEIFEEGDWLTVHQSEVYEDWKTNYDLEVHLYVEYNEPLVGKTRFSTIEHGWPFHARYAEKQSDGRLGPCVSGGMCFGALDKYYHQQPLEFPTAEALEDYLSSRQFDAEKDGRLALQYGAWRQLPDRGAWTQRRSIGYETKVELEKVRAKIDENKPVVLVLISEEGEEDALRQVVAFQYEFDRTRRKTRLWLYDPELIEQEEAILTVIHGAPDGTVRLRYNREPQLLLRGFFINPYDQPEEWKSPAPILGSL